MIVNIDMERLAEREKELVEELQIVRNMLAAARKYGTVLEEKALPVVEPPDATPVNPVPEPEVKRTYIRYKRKHIGALKEMTLALNTGPASERELHVVLGGTKDQILSTSSKIRTDKIAFLNEHGQLQLSPEGKRRAEWFMAHPNYTTYRGDANGR